MYKNINNKYYVKLIINIIKLIIEYIILLQNN